MRSLSPRRWRTDGRSEGPPVGYTVPQAPALLGWGPMDETESISRQRSPSAQPEPDEELMDLLEETPQGFRTLRRGEIVDGVVVKVTRDEILVDIGTKAEAVIPAQETGVSPGELLAAAKPGESIVAMVVEPEDREGHAVLSLARARIERGWRGLQRTFEEGTTIEAEVVDFNRGGLIVDVQGLRGFVPLSQIVDLRQPGAQEDTLEGRIERMKGRVLALKLIEINRRRNRLILSERAADQERRLRERDRLIGELQEGQTHSGRVSSICDFGAFVDLGGADGLVHLTELSWAPVSHPSQMLRVGDQVDVFVLGVDRERKKISLSLKRLRAEPWQTVVDRYRVGQHVVARVTKVVTFGAFVEVEPGVEGLVHVSELSDQRVQHPRTIVREGDVITVKILRIEPERRRLGLSLKQAQAEIEAAETEGLPMVYESTGEAEEGAWMGGARVVRSEQSSEAPGLEPGLAACSRPPEEALEQ